MARSTVQTLRIRQPIDGVDRNAGFSKQPITTVGDAMNVRCRDVFESRVRLGSRPGLVKTFAQNIGAETPVESFTADFSLAANAYIGGTPSTYNTVFDVSNNLNVQRFQVVNIRYRTLLYFDLSSIPIAATIISADLKLWNTGTSTSPEPCKVNRLTTTSWAEGAVTWNSPWTTPGGDYTTTDEASWNMFLSPSSTITQTYRTITGLIPLVQAAVAAGGATHWLLKMLDDSTTPPAVRTQVFRSRGYSVAENCPVLTVTYEV
jgi:hypothetical protein